MAKKTEATVAPTMPVLRTASEVYDFVRSKGLTMRTLRINGQARRFDVAQMRSKDTLAQCATLPEVIAFCVKYIPGASILPTSAAMPVDKPASKPAKPRNMTRKVKPAEASAQPAEASAQPAEASAQPAEAST
jgi:hypothetical protein